MLKDIVCVKMAAGSNLSILDISKYYKLLPLSIISYYSIYSIDLIEDYFKSLRD